MGSRALSAVVVSCALLTAAPLQAQLVTFTSELATVTPTASGFSYEIGGWDDGGTVTGTFEGTDLNSDGQLSSFDLEITAFTMSYTGGTIVPDLSFDSATDPLFDIVYDLNGGPLGDGVAGTEEEGIAAANFFTSPFFLFLYGPGPAALCGAGDPCGGLFVEVPEPTTLALAVGSLGLLGWLRRRYPSIHSMRLA